MRQPPTSCDVAGPFPGAPTRGGADLGRRRIHLPLTLFRPLNFTCFHHEIDSEKRGSLPANFNHAVDHRRRSRHDLARYRDLASFIGERKLVTKSRQGNLPTEVLAELNARLTPPVELDQTRPLLRDYPNIAGLFVLLRVMGLVVVDGKRLRIEAAALAVWRGLNPVEQYFSLLEAWLFRGDAAVLGGAEDRRTEQYRDNLKFLVKLTTSHWTTFDVFCHLYAFAGAPSIWNTQLQARFGLVEVQARPLGTASRVGRGWCLEKARRTPWGTAVAWVMLEQIVKEGDTELWMLAEPEDADFGFLQPAFRPFFPAWEKVFGLTSSAVQPGVYVFKVMFADYRVPGDVWRRLAVPDGASLEDVAEAVLSAFKFTDTEHLYEFRYRDRLGRGRAYFSPYDDEKPECAAEIVVGATELPVKGVMKFLFDYGDSWQFELKLERIDPPGQADARIEVIESTGKAPKQYPSWDEGE